MAELVRDGIRVLVEKSIKEMIEKGTYKNISDLRNRNQDLQQFYFNNKLEHIQRMESTFSTKFTNSDYLNLLDQLEKEMQMNHADDEKSTSKTEINGTVFVNKGETPTLVGVTDDKNNSYEEEKDLKQIASFQNINEINPNDLTKEGLLDYNIIAAKAEATDNKENTEVYFENGNMTSTVAINQDGERSYYTVDEINGSKDLVGHEASKANSAPQKSNVKVKTLSNGHNISAAFTNTLILSFIIGSFFGIVFLAIYTKIMH